MGLDDECFQGGVKNSRDKIDEPLTKLIKREKAQIRITRNENRENNHILQK
jgi:uncharacterized protein YabE (DUF348 family)